MKKSPSILLAMNWNDRRFFEGVVKYANEKKWHISPYLFSENFVPRGWPGDAAITCYGPEMADFISSLNVPHVDVSFEPMEKTVARVQVDNDQIALLAAEHFLSKGYKNFAYYRWPGIPVNDKRGDAFARILRSKGIPAKDIYTLNQTPNELFGNWEGYQKYILEQLHAMPRPLAVFTGQDNLGASLIEICYVNGIHIPQEIAVLGVDDMEFLTENLQVPLSSIDTRLDVLGYEACRRLDQLMQGEVDATAPPVLIQPKKVVQRQSTDMLAISHPAVLVAMTFLSTHYGDAITLEDIGDHAGLSKRGLEKAFLKTLGRTPAAELRRIRLDHAKKMLTETDDKIEAIAYQCGYSNSSNLSFAFRKETKLTPRTYRNKYRVT